MWYQQMTGRPFLGYTEQEYEVARKRWKRLVQGPEAIERERLREAGRKRKKGAKDKQARRHRREARRGPFADSDSDSDSQSHSGKCCLYAGHWPLCRCAEFAAGLAPEQAEGYS